MEENEGLILYAATGYTGQYGEEILDEETKEWFRTQYLNGNIADEANMRVDSNGEIVDMAVLTNVDTG